MAYTRSAESNLHRLRLIGISVSLLILWNGVCDLIYGYSSELSGLDYLSPAAFDTILSAGHRPHWMVMLAQTAGWLYPIYALLFYHWWVGMRRAGFWLAHVPCALLAYAALMIGGIQHAGWAFLSVLERANEIVGSTDGAFFALANRYVIEHFVMGDLTALIALNVGIIWHALAILTGKTVYPRWFVIFSPFGALILTLAVGSRLPESSNVLHPKGHNTTDTGNGAKQVVGVGIVGFGFRREVLLEYSQLLIEVVDDVNVEGNPLTYNRVGEMVRNLEAFAQHAD